MATKTSPRRTADRRRRQLGTKLQLRNPGADAKALDLFASISKAA